MSGEVTQADVNRIGESLNYSSISRTQALSGSLVGLASESCRVVEMFNSSTNVLSFTVSGGAEVTALDSSSVIIHCDNTSKIQVKGTGTLSYLVHR